MADSKPAAPAATAEPAPVAVSETDVEDSGVKRKSDKKHNRAVRKQQKVEDEQKARQERITKLRASATVVQLIRDEEDGGDTMWLVPMNCMIDELLDEEVIRKYPEVDEELHETIDTFFKTIKQYEQTSPYGIHRTALVVHFPAWM
jgi:hypothetical protein